MVTLDYRVTFDDGLKADVIAYTAARKKVTHACLGRLLTISETAPTGLKNTHNIEDITELVEFIFEPLKATFSMEYFDNKPTQKASEDDLVGLCRAKHYNLFRIRRQEDFEESIRQHLEAYLRDNNEACEKQTNQESFEDYMVRNFGNQGWKQPSGS